MKTIDDVRRYTYEVAQRFPAIAGEIEVTAEALELPKGLVAELQLPRGYCSVAEANRLAGVSIGFFALWPSFVRESLEQSLIKANASDSSVGLFGGNTLIAVARYEANPICVASAASDARDQVFLLDTMSSPNWKLRSIATNFEQFLALAANVHRISDMYDGEIKAGQEEMGRCCEALACSPEQTAFWQSRITEMLA
ncbi:hypothetical protein [Paludibacterium paludis]|uniref:hypothetical protein n=1 Tax=Paludibacterium paludis TaxID=1225769 RepID=UPI0016769A05|nr:hypothetical protein [Paludibacterium paludis]